MNKHFFLDYEHVSFLTHLLSQYIFYSGSLNISKNFISLETQLHEQNDVCVSTLILGRLYESLGVSSLDLKERTISYENFLISCLIWLL